MRLKLKKCTFGIRAEKFISLTWGIEAYPYKCETLIVGLTLTYVTYNYLEAIKAT